MQAGVCSYILLKNAHNVKAKLQGVKLTEAGRSFDKQQCSKRIAQDDNR